MENILHANRITFDKYSDYLAAQNKIMNLTSVPEEDTYKRHFKDSLVLLNCHDFTNKSVIDVGTGAGFPGLPLKIAEPSISLTLLDAKHKRTEFLTNLIDILGVSANIITGRAEILSKDMSYRNAYDIAVSRAVSRLSVMCELCVPLIKPGGYFLAHKSFNSDFEIEKARVIIYNIGARLEDVIEYENGVIVVIKNVKETSLAYPRHWNFIVKYNL